ncbi:hypothetical protein M3Y94_01065200 [Aphelenchoides besseyi]|nr:hypothetical protein M3Y94_01065200 [Aphelenchoides besseyi]KAI6224214.1 hypothetical protein M3Y95_00859200 [Aphelenchoides besseyi]
MSLDMFLFNGNEDEPMNSLDLSLVDNQPEESAESSVPSLLQSLFSRTIETQLNSSYQSIENNETPNTSHQNDQTYLCEVCGLLTLSMMELTGHACTRFTLLYECSLCTARYKAAASRNKHERLAHRLHRSNEMAEVQEKLTMEQLTLTEQATRPFISKWLCAICSLAFINRNLMMQHNTSVHLIHNFLCTFCTKMFTTHQRRNRHEQKQHRFVRQAKHSKTATGSLDFERPVQSNDQSSSFDVSQMTVNTSKACRFCGLVVNKRGPLRVHEISHSRRQTAYQCHLCNFYFKSKKLKVAHETTYYCIGRGLNSEQNSENPVLANVQEPREIQEQINSISLLLPGMNSSITSNDEVDVITSESLLRLQLNTETEERWVCPTSTRHTPIDIQRINSTVLLEELTTNPTLIYYDLEGLFDQFGLLPVNHWLVSEECEFLLLRIVAGKHYDFNMNHMEPVWSTSMPRYELSRKENRDSHVVCFCKFGSFKTLIHRTNFFNSHMNFIELITMLIPALELRRSLIIATDHDRQLISKMDLESHRIYVP